MAELTDLEDGTPEGMFDKLFVRQPEKSVNHQAGHTSRQLRKRKTNVEFFVDEVVEIGRVAKGFGDAPDQKKEEKNTDGMRREESTREAKGREEARNAATAKRGDKKRSPESSDPTGSSESSSPTAVIRLEARRRLGTPEKTWKPGEDLEARRRLGSPEKSPQPPKTLT